MNFNTILTANTNGVTTAYCSTGNGEPLLMVNGGAGEKCEYRRFLPYLHDSIRQIAYDQRGLGDTIAGDEPYTLRTLADDAVSLMDALDLERAHVLGFSYGGMLAFEIGLHHPNRVQSLIVGTAPYSFTELKAGFSSLVGLPPEAYGRGLVEICLTPKGQTNEDLVAEMTEGDSVQRRRPSTAAGSKRIAAAADYDMTGLAHKIVAPTLLIYGSEDRVAPPETARRLNKEIPDSQLMLQVGGRHSFFREHPIEVATRVSNWVLSHPVRR